MQGRVFGILVLAAMIWLSPSTPRAAGPQAAAPAAAPGASAEHQATLTQVLRHVSQRAGEDRGSLARAARPRAPGRRPRHVGARGPQAARRRHAAPRHEAARLRHQRSADRMAGRRAGPDRGQAVPGPAGAAPVESRRYSNAIRDLLGLDVDVTSLLPPDDSAFGFDNVADAQGSSPALLQAYLAAARKISAVAVGDLRIGVGSDTYTVRQDLSQDIHLEGLPFGTVGGLVARHAFPVDGEYDFQIRLYRTNLSAIRGLEDPQELELLIDGERVHGAVLGGNEDLAALQTNPTDDLGRHRGDAAEGAALRQGRAARGGGGFPREDFAGVRGQPAAALHPRLRQPVRRRGRATRPVDHHPGAVQRQGRREAGQRRAVLCRPKAAAEEEPVRPAPHHDSGPAGVPPPADGGRDHQHPVVLPRGAEGRELRHRHPVRAAAHPGQPVVRVPARGRAVGAQRRQRLPDLGSRAGVAAVLLLWSTIPDEALLRSAEQGRLRQPAELTAQVRRMLKDAKAAAFVRTSPASGCIFAT